MSLTEKDLAGAAVAALTVLVLAANAQEWWYLGNTRWAAVTMLAIGAVGCPVGARIEQAQRPTRPIVLLSLLGVAALVVGVLAIVIAAQWALIALAALLLALWLGTTLRHAVTPHAPLAVR